MIPLDPGVVLFAPTHLYPCFAATHRARLRSGWGEPLHQGLFSLLVFVAIGCIPPAGAAPARCRSISPPPGALVMAAMPVAA